jgi:prepilin-type N-terminal cleavage/methylation domain-containing protein
MQDTSSSAGFSLIETMIALGVLAVGAMAMGSLFVYGMQSTISSPNELMATQKAQEAIEGVFAARDSHVITWVELKNVNDGGIFLDGEQNLTTPGDDGIVNTDDDDEEDIEQVVFPGPDQTLGTDDDKVQTLDGFKREIRIEEISMILRSVTVTITFPAGSMTRTHSLTTYISAYA